MPSPSEVNERPSSQGSRRKRPRVPESQRRRASVACANCRRLKERCDGKVPCSRCQRSQRVCELKPVDVQPTVRPTGSRDGERVRYLETIASHFLGDIPLGADHLRQVVQNIKLQGKSDEEKSGTGLEELELDEEHAVLPVAQHTAHYSGELSHWNFSQKLRRQIDKRLETRPTVSDQLTVLEYWRASNLRSQDDIILTVRQSLPPKPVADFLADVYFRFAQTNHFFVKKTWLCDRLNDLYTTQRRFTVDDSAWLCSVVMTLAIGTQFSHMASPDPRNGDDLTDQEDSGDSVGLTMYHMAARMMPDVIALASVESVQASLLVAHFALPLDAHGLAYTWFGLAQKIAVQNGMHRKYSGQGLDLEVAELRNKLWWTAYAFERRISVLHGRPVAISQAEMDVQRPDELLHSVHRNELQHSDVMIRLTNWLSEISSGVQALRRCPKHLRSAYFERLLQTRQQLQQWWTSLSGPFLGISRSSPLFRSTAHLHLSFHLNLVFLGRPFTFVKPCGRSSKSNSRATASQAALSKPESLVEDAVNSARAIIDVCNLLETTIGLARASYIEFSSCRAALLTVLAQSLNERSKELRDALDLGMRLLRRMAVSITSAKSEASTISAIEAGIRLLDEDAEKMSSESAQPSTEDSSGYESFRQWVSMWNVGPESQSQPLSDEPAIPYDNFCWSPFDASLFDGTTPSLSSADLSAFESSWGMTSATIGPNVGPAF